MRRSTPTTEVAKSSEQFLNSMEQKRKSREHAQER
jgi:hypothetical protein